MTQKAVYSGYRSLGSVVVFSCGFCMYNTRAVWMHRWLWFCPVQVCMVCGKAFWAGWPRVGVRPGNKTTPKLRWSWLPEWDDTCSRKCSDIDHAIVSGLSGTIDVRKLMDEIGLPIAEHVLKQTLGELRWEAHKDEDGEVTEWSAVSPWWEGPMLYRIRLMDNRRYSVAFSCIELLRGMNWPEPFATFEEAQQWCEASNVAEREECRQSLEREDLYGTMD